MATRYWPDSVHHCEQRESKRKGYPRISDLVTCQHRATAPTKYQHECADKFCDVAFHCISPVQVAAAPQHDCAHRQAELLSTEKALSNIDCIDLSIAN